MPFKKLPADLVDAAVKDFADSGESVATVARRHNIGQSTLWRLAKKKKEQATLKALAKPRPVAKAPAEPARPPAKAESKPRFIPPLPGLKKAMSPDTSREDQIVLLHHCIIDLVLQLQQVKQVAREAGVRLPTDG